MKKYKYKAKKGPQELIEGILAAENTDQAIDKINEMGLLPLQLAEEKDSQPRETRGAGSPFRKIGSRHILFFYRHLARMVASGIPILPALILIAQQTENEEFRGVLENLKERVRQGQPLSESMNLHSGVFNAFDVAMIRTGETAGRLEEALKRIADYRDGQEALRAKVRSAVAYPLFIAGAGFLTVVFMLIYVIPQFSKFFSDLGQDLPLVTRALIEVSRVLQSVWLIGLAGAAAAFYALRAALKNEDRRMSWDRALLRFPRLGKLALMLQISRLARTLELLLKSGIPVLMSLKIAVPVIGNSAVKKEVKDCCAVLEKGGYLSEGLRQGSLFPSFVVHLVRLGEESGKLEESMGEIAAWYEQETAESIKIMTQLLEPVMILVVGGILGLVVMAVLMPIFSMNTVVS
ncbi:MAG: type II secretion system F family protein [Candidatus Omnitrophica bacterium]|nr:type II secretion system F family protein [Candidatus Omnitrophota bacterium]